MTWYSTAQELWQTQELEQTVWQVPLWREGFSKSCLPQTEKVIAEAKLEDLFQKEAEKRHYKSAMDFVLCHFFPVFEKGCRDDYAGKGKKFISLHPKDVIKKVDRLLEAAVTQSVQKDQKKACRCSRKGCGLS